MLRELRETLGTKPWATWLGILFAIHQALILAVLSFSGPKLFALQTSAFTKARYERAINHWDPIDHERILRHFIFDSYHPLIYAVALIAILGFYINRLGVLHGPGLRLGGTGESKMDRWLLAPIVMALCDVVENIIHFSLIKGWPPSNAAVLIFTLAALTKWLLLVAVVVRLFTLGFPAFHFRRKKDPPK